jgi:hypothetical protein
MKGKPAMTHPTRPASPAAIGLWRGAIIDATPGPAMDPYRSNAAARRAAAVAYIRPADRAAAGAAPDPRPAR